MSWWHDHVGELAALGAAWCWVFTSLAFAVAGRRIGPTAVNLLRSLGALLVLAIMHRIVQGVWLPPVDATGLWYLAASGLIGLAIGDQFLFTALVDVGPRISTLLMTMAPPVTAMLAWPMLDEPLTISMIAGIAITTAGIAWVVSERVEAVEEIRSPHRRRGIIFGALAGACQALGLVLAKLGIGHTRFPEVDHLDPLTATLIRMAFGAIGITVIASTLRYRTTRATRAGIVSIAPSLRNSTGRTTAFLCVAAGIILGPVLGVWCSLIAVDRTDAGIAATLMAMTPVFVLPFSPWFESSRITPRAILGAIIAVAGVGILTSFNGEAVTMDDGPLEAQDLTVTDRLPSNSARE